MPKVILVTGASGFLGKKLTETLSRRGHVVYAGVRKLSGVETENVREVKLDLDSDEDYGSSIKQIIERESRLDVLINNAALTLSGPVQNFTREDFLKILNVNVVAPFRLISEVFPHMKASGGGKVINISSLNGLLALPNFSLYSSSKFALEGLGLSLRQELKKYGIWVTNVEPGAIGKKDEPSTKLTHVPAREKFPLLGKLFPMLKDSDVACAVADVLDSANPPARIMLGRDTKIMTFLQRFLPGFVWDNLMSYIWMK